MPRRRTFATGILPALAAKAGSRGMGSPSRIDQRLGAESNRLKGIFSCGGIWLLA
jgi:hypothetical protein